MGGIGVSKLALFAARCSAPRVRKPASVTSSVAIAPSQPRSHPPVQRAPARRCPQHIQQPQPLQALQLILGQQRPRRRPPQPPQPRARSPLQALQQPQRQGATWWMARAPIGAKTWAFFAVRCSAPRAWGPACVIASVAFAPPQQQSQRPPAPRATAQQLLQHTQRAQPQQVLQRTLDQHRPRRHPPQQSRLPAPQVQRAQVPQVQQARELAPRP
mmetsp:Transcript_135419/g.350953  ORF Transcript_135419/g.350953 Transcript_135419/m.350953 type:complete len:215 (-) Transcript_135419:50-694(-)